MKHLLSRTAVLSSLALWSVAPGSAGGAEPSIGAEVMLTSKEAIIRVEPKDDSPDARGFAGCDVLRITASKDDWFRVALGIDGLIAKQTPAGRVLTRWTREKVLTDWTQESGDIWFEIGWVRKNQVVALDSAVDYFTKKIESEGTPFAYVSRACARDGLFFSDKVSDDPTTEFRPQMVLDDLSTAIGLDPKDGYPLFLRALFYELWGVESDELKTEEELNRQIDAETEMALNDLNAAIARDPNLAAAYEERSEICHERRDYAKESSDWKAAHRLDPDNPETASALAWCLATCPDERYRDGAAALELATRFFADGKSAVPFAFELLAAAYAEQGDFKEAEKWQLKALGLYKAASANAEENTPFGYLELGKSDAERAHDRLERYRQGKPSRDPEQ